MILWLSVCLYRVCFVTNKKGEVKLALVLAITRTSSTRERLSSLKFNIARAFVSLVGDTQLPATTNKPKNTTTTTQTVSTFSISIMVSLHCVSCYSTEKERYVCWKCGKSLP